MVKDILINKPILNGDWNIDFSDDQHLEHILLSHLGDFKNAPWIGVGITDFLNAPITGTVRQTIEREIKLHITADGGKATNIIVDNQLSNIQIDVDYE